MISPIGFNSIKFSSQVNKSRLNQNISFASARVELSDLSSFLKSKTYDFICPDKDKLYCASQWVMSDGDLVELAKRKVAIIDFDYDKIAGTKRYAKKLGLDYFGIDEISSNTRDINSCYKGLISFITKIKKPVLLYSMRTKDEPLYLCALYLIKEKGLSVSDAADIIEQRLIIQPRFDLVGKLSDMLKKIN